MPSITLARLRFLPKIALCFMAATAAWGASVNGQIRTVNEHQAAKNAGPQAAVVWLTPASGSTTASSVRQTERISGRQIHNI